MAQPIIPYVNADNVGSTASLLQVLNRELKKSSANIGDGLTLLVINNGEISQSNLNLGSATKFVFLQNGRLQISSASVGSDTKIIKIANGEFQESAGNAGSDIKFVYLQNGTITPTNRSLGSNSKHIFMSNGALTASDANIGGMEESYVVTSDSTPVEGKQYYKKDSGADTYTEITSELTADTDLNMLGYNVYERPVAECHIICMKDGETVVPDKASVGNEACFLYLENGALKATKISAGQSAKLIEFVNGKLKESSASVGGEGKLLELKDGQLVESDSLDIGGEDRLLYVQGGRIVSSGVNIGSDTRSLKVVNGQLVEGSVELAPADSVGEGGGTGGGVIDGVLCKDADGNDVITELTKENGGLSTGMTKLEYTVKNDCYLSIIVRDIDIYDATTNACEVLVGDSVVGLLTDSWSNSDDQESISFPVKAGSVVKISRPDGGNILGPVNNKSKVVIKEFRLNALSVAVGLPNYDRGEDITKEVIRTHLDTPTGYKAKSDGFVLFSYKSVGTIESFAIRGKVANNDVYNSGIAGSAVDDAYVDRFLNSGMVPVRKDDEIDLTCSDINVTQLVLPPDGAVEVKFFPLQGSGESSTGPIEYTIAECPFTLTGTYNPFLSGSAVPSEDKRLISASNVKSRTGRDVDISESTIKLVMDVFYPKHNADGSVYIDGDGFVVPDDSKPMFRDEVSGYHLATGATTNTVEYPPFVVSNVDNNAVVMWSITTGGTSNFIALPSLLNISEASGEFPIVSYNSANVELNDKAYTELMSKAESLGLTNYYIRLTAVIDPNRKNIVESKSGMFVTGDIAKDENGKVCKTLVPYTEWAAKQDSDGKYVYEYTVKTDCWLHADYLVHAHNTASDEVVVTINGEVLGAYAENSQSISDVSTYGNTISMPVKRGAKIGFHSVAQPTHNWETHVAAGSSEILKEPYAIKILEFKMGTELNPAQFPSLAVRVLDCDMGEVDSNLGKTYTWTESELRQIFGPMYSVNESRIEFSTTFYKATSAEGFDDATVKMTDTRDLLQNTAAYLKFPVTISKNDVGENIISVYVPNKGEMLTPVSWDATNSKFVMNKGVLELQNSGMPVGTRMRLNMHISDRRGDMPDELLPNGISPNSKMVRQGDMNIAAANALGNVAYTNEITITESGTCIIMSNFDSDSTGVDYTIVAVQALIGGNWTTIQTAPTQTVSDGRGVQSFNFPIEAGTKIRIATDAGITGAAGNITGTRSELDAMFTHAHQALCWVIPTGKYRNPELNLPGSAGVIDGSIWKDASGNELVTNITPDTTVKEITYNVKNDCYLMIALYNTDISNAASGDGRECVDIFVNGVVVGCLSETNQAGNTNGEESIVRGINVAGGSVVKLLHHQNNGSTTYKLFDAVASGNSNPKLNGLLTFTEFKLRATNVLAAMPDWDESKAVSITSGWVAQNDGFVVEDGAGIPWLKVNDVEVLRGGNDVNNIDHNGWVAVSRGDVVTFGAGTVKFYPVKMNISNVRESDLKALESRLAALESGASTLLDRVYPVGSVYIDANNAATCPIASAMPESTWTNIGSKLLTGASEAPVVGNGKALGLTDGTVKGGMIGLGSGYNSRIAAADTYGADVGTPSDDGTWDDQGSISENIAVGVVTEPDNSGLVAKLGDATGLSVTLWQRTA